MQNIKKRLIMWAGVVSILLGVALVLTLTGSGVDGVGFHWTLIDFVFMGVLLYGSALTFELVARRFPNIWYKSAVALAVVTGLLLIWGNAAVGTVGDDNPVNMIYPFIILIGLMAGALARFEPKKMANIMFTVALAQFLPPLVALFASKDNFAPGIPQVFVLVSGFAIMFVVSGILFKHAGLSGRNNSSTLASV